MAWLTLERQQQIDHTITALKNRTGLSYPQNSLLDIARELGVTVSFAPLPASDSGQNIDGVIHWEPGGAKIIINENYSPTRKTFTLAHELGHYLLHPDQDKLRIDHFNYAESSQESLEETEANYFAASLLMPQEEFINVLSLTPDVSQIAQYFGVSEVAVKNRLKWLQKN